MIRCFFAVLFLAFLSTPARGQSSTTPTSRKQEARGKAIEAKELYDAGKYERALERFTEADALYHTVVLVLYKARCQDKLGKLLEANTSYRRVLGEEIDPGAPDALKEAQAAALQEIEMLKKRRPRLRVLVKGVPEKTVHVWIDGVEAMAWAEARWINPGQHRVAASAEGATSDSITVNLGEGTTKDVEFSLRPVVAPKVAPPKRPIWPEGLALGAGAAGVLVGAITATMASLEPDNRRAMAWVTASTVAFAMGGLTLGVTLLFAPSAPKPGQQRSAGVTGVGFYGTF